MRHLLVLLALTVNLSTAAADDEGSEHTASLYGAPADTLGVTLGFADKTGWSMTVRAKPGAEAKTIALPLSAEHAHYVVFVAPGRTAIAIVEVSAGVTKTRPALAASDGLAWVFAPDGTLLARWTYGQVLTKDELAHPVQSISHRMWTRGFESTASGFTLPVAGGARILTLDAAKHTLR